MSFRKSLGIFIFLLIVSGCGSEANHYKNQGSVADPIDIGVAPVIHYSQIDGNTISITSDAFSYYKVVLPKAGTLYNVKLSELTTDADLFIYSDAAFSTQVGGFNPNDGTTDEVVTYLSISSNQILYIKVSNHDVVGTGLRLDVKETF